VKHNHPQQKFNLMRTIKKFFLSAFVMGTFILYALHKPSSSTDGKLGLAMPQTGAQQSQTLTPAAPDATSPDTSLPQQGSDPNSAASAPTAVPPTTVPPTAVVPAPNTASQTGHYKNGTYTGPEVDAQYGLVQVQAVVQNGKIVNVQFLEYPNDRRTSVRINSIAMPDLQQEAIQAQSANVDLITGATLTSEAFAMSLQSALDQAKG
jgi:uncharacterized protein with FMN-binding domain